MRAGLIRKQRSNSDAIPTKRRLLQAKSLWLTGWGSRSTGEGDEKAGVASWHRPPERSPTQHLEANGAPLWKETPASTPHKHANSFSHLARHQESAQQQNLRHYKSNVQLPQQYFNGNASLSSEFKIRDTQTQPSAATAYPQNNGYGFPSVDGAAMSASASATASITPGPSPLPMEIVSSVLLAMPLLLASMAYPSPAEPLPQAVPAEPAFAHLIKSPVQNTFTSPSFSQVISTGVIKACALTAGSLLLLGIVAKMCYASATLDRRKDCLGVAGDTGKKASRKTGVDNAQRVLGRALCLGLPFYAFAQLGSLRTSMFILTGVAGGLVSYEPRSKGLTHSLGWKILLSTRKVTFMVLLLCSICDMIGITASISPAASISGYSALALAMFMVPPPLPTSTVKSLLLNASDPASASSTSAVPATPWETPPTIAASQVAARAISPLVSTSHDINLTLMAGGILSLAVLIFSLIFPTSSGHSLYQWTFFFLAVGATVAMLLFSEPSSLRTERKLGLAIGLNWALLHSILTEKDSRRIFYFMTLNFFFMLVQTFYGLATGSLGLLSDSVHMFFDCLALVVGLCAAVMSKRPPSTRFPYGLGKMDTLAGFANGIFLMLISIEIVTEAIERLAEGSQMKRIGELLIVSTLGLCVNLVGIMAFDHAHHGHGHGHSHGGHSHGHAHSTEKHAHHEDHQHNGHHHHHDHSRTNTPMSSVPATPSNPHFESHHTHAHHDHGSDNMHGIFLHILADTLGSVAVVISTLLVHFYGWAGFDPLASCFIAILIFASAVPLVISSAKTLLLTVPEDVEYGLRDTLAGISGLRGVVGYNVPRFWLEDSGMVKEASHDQDHQHRHGEPQSSGGQRVLGVMHIIASRLADVEDVRERTTQFLKGRGMDIVIQVEREGEGRCWCGGGA
ncbi:MAG: putative zinc transporter msc2 [Pycnora praestabilis]|nr:MAG: putative zinc transporter msc2 [Pycnora praestabilis]